MRDDKLIEAMRSAVERELDIAYLVLTDPMTLRRLKAERIARAALAAAEAEGYRLVPVEPTDEMKQAGMDVLMNGSDIYCHCGETIYIETITPDWLSDHRGAGARARQLLGDARRRVLERDGIQDGGHP